MWEKGWGNKFKRFIMKRQFSGLLVLPLCALLTACGPIGAKAANISIIYFAAAALSLLLLIGYCLLDRKRNPWFLLLFTSVLVVNTGYFLLSTAQTLEWALWCNRITYLGSVLLPMSMLLSILDVTRLRFPRWLPAALLMVGAAVFFIAASPGYLPIYYAEVELLILDGVSTLDKVYGPLHVIYLLYLMGYFAGMAGVIAFAAAKKQLRSPAQAAVILTAVFVNLCVWLAEQLVMLNFEFLSISYIISELFLLGLHLFLLETEKNQPLPPAADTAEEVAAVPDISPIPTPDQEEQQKLFMAGLLLLTQTERAVYNCYVSGKSTKQVLAELNIKENTLKFHNKNLYSKLGVTSRKQLLNIYNQLAATQNQEK